MATARDYRRCALQAIYQIECAGNVDTDSLLASLAGSCGDTRAHRLGIDLAASAWDSRDTADGAISSLTPAWPMHRQPAIDRSILRLAWFELAHATAPPKVIINESIELAREFSTRESPPFINGVLDRLARSLHEADNESSSDT